MKSYDLIVIGTGSGGLSIGLTMHSLGFKVLLIEKEERNIGGECLNTGCVPSKALIHVARMMQQTKLANEFGLDCHGTLNFERVKEYIRQQSDIIRSHENADYFRKLGIEVEIGAARFTGKDTLEAAGKPFKGKNIIIATGSQPLMLEVPGVDQVPYYDNRTIFNIPELPKHLLVVGGGPIAMELGQAFRQLGSEVTVVQSGDRIMEKELPEVANLLMERLMIEGMQFRLQSRIIAFPSAKTALLEGQDKNQSQLTFDAVLVGIGRKVNLEGLNLAAAGIETVEGKLKLNAYLRSTNRQVYAIGDVTGQRYFSHTAEMQAALIANNFFSPFKQKISYDHFSWVTFTSPEVATFGLSEQALMERGIPYEKIVTDFAEDDRATVDNYRYGKQWLYLSKSGLNFSKRRILGGTMVAPHAGEMIQDLVLANTAGLTTQDVTQKTYAYPIASRVSKITLLNHFGKEIPAWLKRLLHWLY